MKPARVQPSPFRLPLLNHSFRKTARAPIAKSAREASMSPGKPRKKRNERASPKSRNNGRLSRAIGLQLSCKSWCVFSRGSGRQLLGYQQDVVREVASLTKIVNYLACAGLARRLGLFVDLVYFRVTAEACAVGGTSARLVEGEWLLARDLFYAMLLPSGNDAALLLAQYFGALMQTERKGQGESVPLVRSMDLTGLPQSQKLQLYQGHFVRQMNAVAIAAGLQTTYFTNPHGSALRENHGTAAQMCLLCDLALKDRDFALIVAMPSYSGTVRYASASGALCSKQAVWQNTNQLLLRDERCLGLKTGYTSTAGGCLAAVYEWQGRQFVVVSLGSSGMDERFRDSQRIAGLVVQAGLR